jgi:gluconokinase
VALEKRISKNIKSAFMDCIISIELGTNAVRVYAFDLNGKTIGFAKGSYPTFHPCPEHSEQDPEQIFITMLYVLKNFLSEKVYPQKYNVVTICFSASMHSLLAIDKHGVPLGNVITWADNRGNSQAKALKDLSISKAIYESTGTPIHPMSSLVKIKWMNEQNQQVFKKTAKFLSLKSYIIHQLTGVYALDYSLASATGMLNIYDKKWDGNALDYAGISKDQLPDTVPVFYQPGKLLPQYRVSLGLSENVRILIGSSDGCLATLGAGVWASGKATVTIEDSAAVRVVGKKILQDEGRRIFNYVLDEQHYVSGGPSNSGGVIFEWFAKRFGDFNYAYDLEKCIDDLVLEATAVGAGAEGLLFLPYLLGERAPIWNPGARGVFFGININHERKHFTRAAVEGIIFEMYSIAKMLQQHRDINSISVNGSFASIPLCAQLIADVFNMPVSVSPNTSSVSLGAYLLSATDLGIFSDIENAAKSIEIQPIYLPTKNHQTIYSKHFATFERITAKLIDEFDELAG